MLGRAELTAEEVKILRGVARQVLWAAGHAGLTIPPDPDETDR
jgi:tRNA C32,U32 (ribose-2'-O)-methylase TrmJ